MKNQRHSHSLVISLLCIGVLAAGCSHSLVVKNLATYQSFGVTTFEKPVKIGIVTTASEPEQKVLLNGIATALASYSAQVIMPYVPNSQREVDIIANVDITAEHKGSGWNFLVNFPGFLIFTPAWNGYIYNVKYAVNCTLSKGATKEHLDQFSVPIALDIRHAAINRTWTEVSYFEVGAIALIGGLVFISYDNSVTPLLGEKIEGPIGKYIAQEIIKRINAHGGFSQIRLREQPERLAFPTTKMPVPHA